MGLCSPNQPQGCPAPGRGLTCPSPATCLAALYQVSSARRARPVLLWLRVGARCSRCKFQRFPGRDHSPSAVGGVGLPSGGLQSACGHAHP